MAWHRGVCSWGCAQQGGLSPPVRGVFISCSRAGLAKMSEESAEDLAAAGQVIALFPVLLWQAGAAVPVPCPSQCPCTPSLVSCVPWETAVHQKAKIEE